MRLNRLILKNYGAFAQKEIDLSSGKEGIHVIYGPNEAGKSTALRALTCLLFGVPHQCPDAPQKSADLRILGSLTGRHVGPIDIQRRKGRVNTLLAPDGNPLDESSLRPYLSGLNRDAFSLMFGLDHPGLVRGGTALLEDKGDVGESLFAAGAGLSNLHEVRRKLQSEMEDLYKPRGSSKKIHIAAKAYKDARAQVQNASLSGVEWKKQSQALADTEARAAQLRQDLDARRREEKRIERIQAALPALADRKHVQGKLAELGAVIELSEAFTERRQAAELRQVEAQANMEHATAGMKELEERLASLDVPVELLDQENRIIALQESLGSHRKALRDAPALRQGYDQLKARAESILAEIKPGADLADADKLRLTQQTKSRIRRLAIAAQATRDRCDNLASQCRKEESDQQDLERQLAAQSDEHDPGPLHDLLERCAPRRAVESDLEELMREFENQCDEIEHMVEQLKLKQLSWEQIENLAVPDDATVDRYEALLAEKQAGIARIIASRSDAEKELAQLATRMVALDALGELPSLEALEQSRRRRDQGWALIRDAWLGEGADRDALAAYLGGDDLDVVYEKAVRLSDRIADDLRKEAARVTQNAELKNQKEAIEERLRNDAARQELLDKDWTAVQQEWRALWEGLNIEPLSPREMQGWLRGFIQLRQQIREAVIQRNQCAALEAARDAVRAEVCQHLELFNETFDATDTLPALLDRCRRKLAFLTERCGEKKSLQEKLEEVSAEHARLRLELEDARQELAEWFEDWKEAINPLGLPQEATPEEAQDMVQRIDELLQGLGEMQAIDARLAGMARDEDAFRAEVATLVERVGPDLGETESIEAAEELRRRMDRARKDHTLMTDCEKQLKASREQFESANAAKGAAEAALAAMCREAGCEDREGLQEAERRSIECRRLKERLNDLESELSRLTGTSEFDAFEAEADQIDKDDIPGLLAALGHEIAELDTELHECMERIGSIRGDLKRMTEAPAASDSMEEAESHLETLDTLGQRYLRLCLAGALLRDAIETFRRENQGPILKRAGEIFSSITCGSFADLDTEFGSDDMPVLMGKRNEGDKLGVAEMSDGTRDQLYLALRLANVERHARQNEPMPLIIDDVLVNFDDERSRAALSVLAELSSETQVIFFTHHKHLVALAEESIAPGTLFVQNL